MFGRHHGIPYYLFWAIDGNLPALAENLDRESRRPLCSYATPACEDIWWWMLSLPTKPWLPCYLAILRPHGIAISVLNYCE